MKKKGFQLSFNFIVIAIIGLIVMAILLAMFVGKGRSFSEGTDDCYTQGGFCARSCGEGFAPLKGTCPYAIPQCCWDSGQGEKVKIVTGELF